jgi:hypothetical protein
LIEIGRENRKAGVRVRRVLDIEENIWSAAYGLKGKLDASLEILLEDTPLVVAATTAAPTARTSKNQSSGRMSPLSRSSSSMIRAAKTSSGKTKLIVPFELKTGKYVSSSHTAQLVLYTLLMSDRYDANIVSGLLYHLQLDSTRAASATTSSLSSSTGSRLVRSRSLPDCRRAMDDAASIATSQLGPYGHMRLVPALHDEIRALLMRRNELAGYLSAIAIDRSTNPTPTPTVPSSSAPSRPTTSVPSSSSVPPWLPPLMVDSPRTCQRCFLVASCSLMHRTFEAGEASSVVVSSSMGAHLFEGYTSHLTPTHTAYLRRWLHLLDLEQRYAASTNHELWTMPASVREKLGRCIGHLEVVSAIRDTITPTPMMSDENIAAAAAYADGQSNSNSKINNLKSKKDEDEDEGTILYTFSKPSGVECSSFLESRVGEKDLVILSREFHPFVGAEYSSSSATGFLSSQGAISQIGLSASPGGIMTQAPGPPPSSQYAIARAIIVAVTPTTITVRLAGGAVSLPGVENPPSLKQSRRRDRIVISIDDSPDRNNNQNNNDSKRSSTSDRRSSGLSTWRERKPSSNSHGQYWWRLDKDDFGGTHRMGKENILQLFLPNVIPQAPSTKQHQQQHELKQQEPGRVPPLGGDYRRRRMVVELEPPIFSDHLESSFTLHDDRPLTPRDRLLLHALALIYHANTPEEGARMDIETELARGRHSTSNNTNNLSVQLTKGQLRLIAEYQRMNSDQRIAIARVLMCHDYTLILGMPGTGKSSTVVFLVRLLVALHRTVLITSYTHSAVDNLVMKLASHSRIRKRLLRLGRTSQIHPNVRAYALPDTEKLPSHIDTISKPPIISSEEQHSEPVNHDAVPPTRTSSSSSIGTGSMGFLGGSEVTDDDLIDMSLPDEPKKRLSQHHQKNTPINDTDDDEDESKNQAPILTGNDPPVSHPLPQPFHSLHDVRQFVGSKSIVATTCLGIAHAMFYRRTLGGRDMDNESIGETEEKPLFDYCIVDEASQITQPVVLGPIRYASRFVLVGDHNQLPPLVRSTEAREGGEGGLAVSLFKLLADAHPLSVVSLRYQYRMNEDILQLANRAIYANALKCGSDAVAKSSLTVPLIDSFHQLFEPSLLNGDMHDSDDGGWLRSIMNPDARVVFLDTSLVPAHDTTSRSDVSQVETKQQMRAALTRLNNKNNDNDEFAQRSCMNPTEAVMVAIIVDALIRMGVLPYQIGVISPYNAQLKLLRRLLSSCIHGAMDCEAQTVDRYQGRDKDVIIMTMVRSNNDGAVGSLLRDWRRINVAITRAKKKLIIIGDPATLRHVTVLATCIDIMNHNKWSIPLPMNGHLFYNRYRYLSELVKSSSLALSATDIAAMQAAATVPTRHKLLTPTQIKYTATPTPIPMITQSRPLSRNDIDDMNTPDKDENVVKDEPSLKGGSIASLSSSMTRSATTLLTNDSFLDDLLSTLDCEEDNMQPKSSSLSSTSSTSSLGDLLLKMEEPSTSPLSVVVTMRSEGLPPPPLSSPSLSSMPSPLTRHAPVATSSSSSTSGPTPVVVEGKDNMKKASSTTGVALLTTSATTTSSVKQKIVSPVVTTTTPVATLVRPAGPTNATVQPPPPSKSSSSKVVTTTSRTKDNSNKTSGTTVGTSSDTSVGQLEHKKGPTPTSTPTVVPTKKHIGGKRVEVLDLTLDDDDKRSNMLSLSSSIPSTTSTLASAAIQKRKQLAATLSAGAKRTKTDITSSSSSSSSSLGMNMKQSSLLSFAQPKPSTTTTASTAPRSAANTRSAASSSSAASRLNVNSNSNTGRSNKK